MKGQRISPLKLVLGYMIWVTLFQALPYFVVMFFYANFVWTRLIFALLDAPQSVLVAGVVVPFFVLTLATLLLSGWLGLIIVKRFLTRAEMRAWLIGNRSRPMGIKISEWLLQRLYK